MPTSIHSSIPARRYGHQAGYYWDLHEAIGSFWVFGLGCEQRSSGRAGEGALGDGLIMRIAHDFAVLGKRWYAETGMACSKRFWGLLHLQGEESAHTIIQEVRHGPPFII